MSTELSYAEFWHAFAKAMPQAVTTTGTETIILKAIKQADGKYVNTDFDFAFSKYFGCVTKNEQGAWEFGKDSKKRLDRLMDKLESKGVLYRAWRKGKEKDGERTSYLLGWGLGAAPKGSRKDTSDSVLEKMNIGWKR